MKALNKKLSFLSILFLFSFAITQISFAIVTRDEMMSVAESYKNHLWTASKENVCSNKIVGRVRIDTPDKNCKSACYNLGWWDSAGETNQSVPYKWGGFNTLIGFDNGIRAGACGGDVYKRSIELSTDGASNTNAVGIDCSGFISKAWDQNVKYSTRSIPKAFRELGKDFEFTDERKYRSMGKGDAFNIKGYHVMLCKEDDPFVGEKTEVLVYEASGNDWKVWDRTYTFEELTDVKVSKSRPSESYYPYSFFKQIDIDLIIDNSGSMGGNEGKMNSAKSAARMFISMMGEKDKIGVVSFNGEAELRYKLTEITKYSKDEPSLIKQAAKDAVSRIFASGGTSIGAGMQMGFDQFKTYGKTGERKDDVRAMILMSDGQDGTSILTDETLNKIIAYNNIYKNNKIKVCTIGFGEGADQELLSNIANKTDCSYQYATNLLDLYFTYRSLQMEVAGEDTGLYHSFN